MLRHKFKKIYFDLFEVIVACRDLSCVTNQLKLSNSQMFNSMLGRKQELKPR
jgi:hypothetical protein